jgi:hypothetical protein
LEKTTATLRDVEITKLHVFTARLSELMYLTSTSGTFFEFEDHT